MIINISYFSIRLWIVRILKAREELYFFKCMHKFKFLIWIVE